MTTDWKTSRAVAPPMVSLAEYEKLRAELAKTLITLERVTNDRDQLDARRETDQAEMRRAIALAEPIVEAMLVMFDPDEPLADDDTVGPKLSELTIKNLEVLDTLTYGQLEVASGALDFWK